MSGETVIDFTKPSERESNNSNTQFNNMQQNVCPERQRLIILSRVNARATKASRNLIICNKTYVRRNND